MQAMFESIALVSTGVVAGIFGSMVGGGALLTLPVLLFAGLPIHLAIGSSRFAALFLELFSALKFYKEGQLHAKRALVFGVVASTGALVGSQLLLVVPADDLSIITPVLLVVVLIITVLGKNLGIKPLPLTKRNDVFALLATAGLGLYGGFFAVGFGTLIMIVFLLTGFSYISSAAMSRLVGVLVGLVASITFALHGLIYYPSAVPLAIGVSLGGWIGVGIGIKQGDRYIHTLFIVIVGLSVIKLAWDAWV